jgi:hypothetical protein
MPDRRMFEKHPKKSYIKTLEDNLTYVFGQLVDLESQKGKVNKGQITDIRRYLGNCMSAENLKQRTNR